MSCLPFKILCLRGALEAQLVERAPHVQRLCPHCSDPRFDFTLWPFATCHSHSQHFLSSPEAVKPDKLTHYLYLLLT